MSNGIYGASTHAEIQTQKNDFWHFLQVLARKGSRGTLTELPGKFRNVTWYLLHAGWGGDGSWMPWQGGACMSMVAQVRRGLVRASFEILRRLTNIFFSVTDHRGGAILHTRRFPR